MFKKIIYLGGESVLTSEKINCALSLLGEREFMMINTYFKLLVFLLDPMVEGLQTTLNLIPALYGESVTTKALYQLKELAL